MTEYPVSGSTKSENISEIEKNIGKCSFFSDNEGANLVIEKSGNILIANSLFFDLFGIPEDELDEGLNFYHLKPEKSSEYSREFNDLRLKDPYNSPKTTEINFHDSNGGNHRFVYTAAKIPGTENILISALPSDLEVKAGDKQRLSSGEKRETARRPKRTSRRSERANAISEKKNTNSDQYFHFTTLVENLPDTVFVLVGGKIAYINNSGIEFFRIKNRYDIIGKSPEDYIKLVSGNRFSEIYKQFRVGTFKFPFETEIELYDGRTEIIDISSFPVIYEGLVGIQFLVRDVSERKNARSEEISRIKKNKILNQILSAANSSVFVDEMLDTLLDTCLNELDLDAAWIYAKNDEGITADLLGFKRIPSWFEDKYSEISIREWPYNMIFFAGQPRYTENLPDNLPGISDTEIMEDLGIICYAGIPLISDNAVVGALFVARDSKASFTQFEKITLEKIGTEIGTALVRCIIQEKIDQEYSDICDSLRIAIDDLSEIYEEICRLKSTDNYKYHPESRCSAGVVRYADKYRDDIKNLSLLSGADSFSVNDLRIVQLDSALKFAADSLPGVNFILEYSDECAYADDDLYVLFQNIISYVAGYTKDQLYVSVRTDSANERVLIVLEFSSNILPSGLEYLTGSSRFFSPGLNRENLPLYVAKLLLERYNGRIEIPCPESGECILSDSGSGVSYIKIILVKFSPQPLN